MLIDAGLSLRELGRRMAAVGLHLRSIDALVLSHGHNDHVRGAFAISRGLGVPVYAGRASAAAAGVAASSHSLEAINGDRFSIGDLDLEPFTVPHDAEETLGFRISDGRAGVGFATDLGSATLEVIAGLSDCDAVVLESNHDEDMLLRGPYPAFLKRRVHGPSGHLSNADAAELLFCIRHPGLRHVALAHLSRTNNAPELPLAAARRVLGGRSCAVSLTLGWQFKAGEIIRL